MGTFLGPQCIPYTYMDPLGRGWCSLKVTNFHDKQFAKALFVYSVQLNLKVAIHPIQPPKTAAVKV